MKLALYFIVQSVFHFKPKNIEIFSTGYIEASAFRVDSTKLCDYYFNTTRAPYLSN